MRLDSNLSMPRQSLPAATPPKASRSNNAQSDQDLYRYSCDTTNQPRVITPTSIETNNSTSSRSKTAAAESSFEDMSTHCLANSLHFAKFFCSNEDSDDNDDDQNSDIETGRYIAAGAGCRVPSLNTNLSELTAGTGTGTATRSRPTTPLLSAPGSMSALPPPLSKANPIHSMELSLESVSIADGTVKGFINNAHLYSSVAGTSITSGQMTPCISNLRSTFSHDNSDHSSVDEHQRQSEAREKLFRLANQEMMSQAIKYVQLPEGGRDLKANDPNTTPTRRNSKSPDTGSKGNFSESNECDETTETAVLDLSMSPMSEKNNKSTDNGMANDKDDADNRISQVSIIPSNSNLTEQEVVLVFEADNNI